MAALGDYLIAASDPRDPNKTLTGPQSVARKRTLAEQLMQEGGNASPIISPWQGVARMAKSLVGGYQVGAANREEDAGRQSAQEATAKLGNGSDNASLIAVLENPYSTPGAQQIAKTLYEARNKPPAQQAPTETEKLLRLGHIDPNSDEGRDIIRGKLDPTYRTGGLLTLGSGSEVYDPRKREVVHKNEDAGALLDEPTTQAMAAQYLAGDQRVLQNLGRGAQGAQNIVKLREEITRQAQAQGLDGKGIVNNFNEQAGNLAGQRAVGTRAANISLAANEANNMLDLALEASDKVPRSQFMPWNKVVQAVQTGTSSPELARLHATVNSSVNAYARAITPTGTPTEGARERGYKLLNEAQGPEAFKEVIRTMRQEMELAKKAPGQVRKELRGETETPRTPSGTLAPGQSRQIGGVTITREN